MSAARRRALFQWYRSQGFSTEEARTLRNRSRGWYDDFQRAKRTNPELKPPTWRPDAREQRQRFREARRAGLSRDAASALRRTSALKFEGAKRSLRGTRQAFGDTREGRRVLREELNKATSYNGIRAAIDRVYARFRPQRQRGSRAARAGVRQGRVV